MLLGIAAIIYQEANDHSLCTDFAGIVKTANLLQSTLLWTIGCNRILVVESMAKRQHNNYFKNQFKVLFFASIISAFGFRFPVINEKLELLPGLLYQYILFLHGHG